MESGIWFATKEDAEASKVPANDPEHEEKPLAAKAKPRAKPKPKVKLEPVVVEDSEDVLPEDDSVFEVKADEDF
jgi:hypothetical protein